MASLEEYRRRLAEQGGYEYTAYTGEVNSGNITGEQYVENVRNLREGGEQIHQLRANPYVAKNTTAYSPPTGMSQRLAFVRAQFSRTANQMKGNDPASKTFAVRLNEAGFAGRFKSRAFNISSLPNQVPMEVKRFSRPTQEQIELYGKYIQQPDGTYIAMRELPGANTTLKPGNSFVKGTIGSEVPFLNKEGTLRQKAAEGLTSGINTGINKTGGPGQVLRGFKEGVQGAGQVTISNFSDLFAMETTQERMLRDGLAYEQIPEDVKNSLTVQYKYKDDIAGGVGAGIRAFGTSIISPVTFAGAGVLGGTFKIPGKTGKGAEKKVTEFYDWTSSRIGGGVGKTLDKMGVSETSKNKLLAPLTEVATDGLLALSTLGIGAGISKSVKTTSRIIKDPIEHNINLQTQLATYTTNLEKELNKINKQGRQITPQLAEVINNKVAKESPIDTSPTIMTVPTLDGDIRLQTNQKIVLQSLLKGRENFNYKQVNTLGDGPDGKAIEAKFEWDPKAKESTLYTTDRDVSTALARQLGHGVRQETASKIYQGMDVVFPNYFQKANDINSSLASYAVSQLGGSATAKQINTKIENLADNFKSDIQALSKEKNPTVQYAQAFRSVIDSPKKALEKAPEFSQFVKYSMGEVGTMPRAAWYKALDGGMSQITLQRGIRQVKTEQARAVLQRVQEDAIKAAQKPEAKKEFYESKDTPDVEGAAVKETPAVEKKGVDEKETWLTKEAKGTKTVEEFERNIKSVYGKALASESPQAKSLVNDIEQIDDLGEFYKQATQKPVVKKATKAPVTSKKTKEASTTAKTTKKATEAKSEPKKATSEQKKTKEEGPDWIWGKEGGPKKKAEKKLVEGQRKSKMVERLNKELPDGMKLDEIYDVKHRNDQLDTAAKLIEKDKAEAIQKAYNPKTDVDQREALLIELGEVAKKNNDFVAVRDLFMERSAMLRQSGRAIDLEKAAILLNPHEKYMRDVVNARLHKVKVTAEDINNATKAKAKGEKVDVKIKNTRKQITEKTRKSFKIKDAQEIFDQLTC